MITSILDGPGTGVIIAGDTGCMGIMGKLYCDEEVFINGILIE
jgi:hypothetical protein